MKKITFLFTLIILNFLVLHKSYANTIFQDNFNDIDGTSINIHNPLLINYVADPCIINNNQAYNPGPNNCNYYVSQYLTDAKISADFIVNLTNNSWADLFLRETDQPNGYGAQLFIRINPDGSGSLEEITVWPTIYKYNFPAGTFTNGKIVNFFLQYVGTNLTAGINGKTYLTNPDTAQLQGTFGFAISPNERIDNLLVQDVDSLSVPLFKQTDNPWGQLNYDTAYLWNASDPTIGAWGCALTSAAMIFKYYGYNTLPGSDFTPLNPGSLNDWLKSQPDGYVGTGWVNWLALSRLSKIATSTNFISKFDALEYHRTSGANTTQLTDDLNNGLPDIVEEPGHFIVAKGINDTTFDINDPYYDRATLTDGYNNTFLSLGRYVPSHTDLSYIMAVTDPDITLQVLNDQGNDVADSFIQQPIIDPINNTSHNSAISLLYDEQPSNGKYQMHVSGTTTKSYKVTLYFYDQDGNVQMATKSGIITPTTGNTFTISFDKLNSKNNEVQKSVTYDSVIHDINNAQKLKLINQGLGNGLMALVKEAQKITDKHKAVSIKLLNDGIKLLQVSKGHPILISQEAYSILLEDFTILRDSLK